MNKNQNYYEGYNNVGLHLKANRLKGKTWLVTFTDTGSTRKANIDNIKKGKVKDLYYPSRYGIGYDGEFIRVPYWRKAKDLWSNMLKRCYFEKDSKGYFGRCTVAPRWHCFANFLEDMKTLPNFDKWLENTTPYELDKDSIVPNNSVYSKDTCMFLDRHTNRANGKGGKKLVDGCWVTTGN